MDKKTLKKHLLDAADMETLITPKNDPENLPTTHDSYKSVLTPGSKKNIKTFIASEKWDAREYKNINHRHSPYIEIEPWPESGFSVTASGVAPNATSPSVALDRFVVASGTKNG